MSIRFFTGLMLFFNVVCILPDLEPAWAGPDASVDRAAPSENYREIRKRFAAYDRGWFGSRPYYRRELYTYLVDTIGKEIVTDYEYMLVYPDIERGEFHCRLRGGTWLVIRGDVDRESLKNAVVASGIPLSAWWRSGRLVAVRGTMRHFRISEGEPRKLTLVFKKIYITVINQ